MDGVHATCVNSNHSGPNCKSKLPVSGRTSPWKCCPAASPRLPEDRCTGHSRSSNHSVFDKQPICSLDEPGDWTWQSDDDGASSCRKTKWRTVGSVISVRRTCNISAGRDGSVLDSTESRARLPLHLISLCIDFRSGAVSKCKESRVRCADHLSVRWTRWQPISSVLYV